MARYIVRFTTKSGDYDKEWTEASSPREAAENIIHEHWNIQKITSVEKII